MLSLDVRADAPGRGYASKKEEGERENSEMESSQVSRGRRNCNARCQANFFLPISICFRMPLQSKGIYSMEGDEGKKSENFKCSGGWEQSVWGIIIYSVLMLVRHAHRLDDF